MMIVVSLLLLCSLVELQGELAMEAA